MTPIEESKIEQIRRFYGEAPRISDWVVVEQAAIDKFGEATCDVDWLHTDPLRASNDGPFGGTIAFGFWTLALLTHLARRTTGSDYPDGALYGLNYGLDRVRWIAPVPVGARVRNQMRLIDVEARGNGRFLVKTENQVELEGSEKPAMIAEWLILLVYA